MENGVSVPTIGRPIAGRPQIGFVNPLRVQRKKSMPSPLIRAWSASNPAPASTEEDNSDSTYPSARQSDLNTGNDSDYDQRQRTDSFGMDSTDEDRIRRREEIREQLARNRANVANMRQQLHNTSQQNIALIN
jgi:hypothetical protein